MPDPRVERETLGSFLVDLPPGAHAVVVRGALSFEDALSPCSGAARDADELLVHAGGPRSPSPFVRAGRDGLAAVAARARAEGRRGVLVVVDAEESRGADAEGHDRMERALGQDPIPDMRIVCVYAREQLARDPLDALHAEHVAELGPEASEWP